MTSRVGGLIFWEVVLFWGTPPQLSVRLRFCCQHCPFALQAAGVCLHSTVPSTVRIKQQGTPNNPKEKPTRRQPLKLKPSALSNPFFKLFSTWFRLISGQAGVGPGGGLQERNDAKSRVQQKKGPAPMGVVSSKTAAVGASQEMPRPTRKFRKARGSTGATGEKVDVSKACCQN